LAACRGALTPDDPVKDPDILPDTSPGDSDTDEVDTDLVDTDVADTDVGGETAVPPAPVLCQPQGKIRTIDDLDRVIQTGTWEDRLLAELRWSPAGSSLPGQSALFARRVGGWSGAVEANLVEIDVDVFFASGLSQSLLFEYESFPSLLRMGWSHFGDLDPDGDVDHVVEYLEAPFAFKRVAAYLDVSGLSATENVAVSTNCTSSSQSRLTSYGRINLDSTGDLLILSPSLRCADDYAYPWVLQYPPYRIADIILDGYASNHVFGSAEDYLLSDNISLSYDAFDANDDGFIDIISDSGTGLSILYGPFPEGATYINDSDLTIQYPEGVGAGFTIIPVSDQTGDGLTDVYVWSKFGGRNNLGSLSLLSSPFLYGVVDLASIAVSEWSMVDAPALNEPVSGAWMEEAGDLNGDGFTDVLVYLYDFPIWRTGRLTDTATDSADSADSALARIDTDVPTGPQFEFGMSIVIPGGVYGRRDMDEGALRVVRTDRPRPLGDVNGDGLDDLWFQTAPWHAGPPKYGLLQGCEFPLP
jgi:hypothetical protein